MTEPRGLLEPTLSPQGYATATGAVLGTPGYMSPEQVRGDPVDARSDLFAAGTIVYELLAGHRAFQGSSVVESGHAILHDEPEPLPEAVPQPVARVVQRCLAKDPEQRFQSARDLAFALDALRGPTGSFGALRGAPARRWVRPALGLAAAALIAGAILATTRERRSNIPRSQMLTFRRGSVLSARFAPDGKTVHYTAAWNGAPPQVYSTSVESPESRPLGFGDAQLLSVSPSGELALSLRPRLILFDGSRGTLARVSPLGEVPREMATNVEYADWSPDGTQLAVARIEGGQSRLEFPLGEGDLRGQGLGEPPARLSRRQAHRLRAPRAARRHRRPGDGGGRLGSGRALEPGIRRAARPRLGAGREVAPRHRLAERQRRFPVARTAGQAPGARLCRTGEPAPRGPGSGRPRPGHPDRLATGDSRSSPPTGSSGRWSGSTGGSSEHSPRTARRC